jgi:hypothetical protein
VPEIPDTLVLRRHRDLVGVRPYGLWSRWIVLGLLTVLAILALLDVFGQRPITQTATAPSASLELYAPEHLRSGLLWSARFHIRARDELKNATLVLDPGWAEGMAINTIEPSPIGEASRNGRLALGLGHIPKGKSFVLYMQFQVNATNIAWRRPQNVELDDGDRQILLLHHHVTIYP